MTKFPSKTEFMDEVAFRVLPSLLDKNVTTNLIPKEAAELAFQYAEALWEKRADIISKDRSQRSSGKVGVGVIASMSKYNLED
jgi:hypothetical protein